ncbi:ATP-binding protein [Pseudogemmobacter sp. W21_MBD1_M6]|uniref:ATP-binding protein n=1 Tax=Pseudogemmobacter sp. W21_MBD1_M6 TaxID=3240271 RepID=UPI003F988B97
MWPRSLQWRLSISLVLGISLLWVAASVVTARNMRHEMDEVFDSALEETAQRILPLAVLDIINREEEGLSQRVATLRAHDEYFTYLVRDAEGRVLLRSHDAQDDVFPPFTQNGFANSATHRLYFDSALQGTVSIAVAEPLSHRRSVAKEALTGLAYPLGVLVPLSLLGIWALVRVSMRQVRALRSEIEARGSGDLAPVATGNLPSEIEPLAGAVNTLLTRVRRTLEAERSFTANSAHELRTPVAAALAQTQRLIAETNDKTARDRAILIEGSLQRLSRLSEKLMQLARAEGGQLRSETPVDVAPALALVVAELGPDAARVRVTRPKGPALSSVDLDAFAILARNLIENALKHGEPAQPVLVALTDDGGLTVTNAGPFVPPDLLAQLSRPFTRGTTGADGTGLGLAIAAAIATGSGGTLALASPATGHSAGFEARYRPA